MTRRIGPGDPACGFRCGKHPLDDYFARLRLPWLQGARWDLVVLDEAQAIKNPGAQQTRAVKKLEARAQIALAGTPVANRLSDPWSIFDLVSPGLLGSAKEFSTFVRRLAEMGREAEAVRPFLREALGSPRLARLLAGVRQDEPRKFAEVADHNAGVWLWRQTTPYRSRPSPRGRRFVARLVRHPRLAALFDEVRDLRRKMETREDEAAYRGAFDRHHEITGAVFGDRLAAEIEPDLGYRRPALSAERLAAMPCPSRHPM